MQLYKNPNDVFCRNRKTYPKIHMKSQGTAKEPKQSRKRVKLEESHFLQNLQTYYKTYYKTIVIKQCSTDTETDQWTRLQSSEINLCIYNQTKFDKDGTTISRLRSIQSQRVGHNWSDLARMGKAHGKMFNITSHSVQFRSVAQSCPTLCDPMNHSTPGLPVYHQLPESTQTHVYWVGDAIQPSHPLSSPSPPALNLSHDQGLFKWVSSLHQVAKVLEFQPQHQSFQWTPRTDLL